MTALHILFQVGGSEYAIPAEQVLVMESFDDATHVPGAPSWVAGLVQIRGEVLPVVDLRARFGLAATERGLDARVVVVRCGTRQVGLLADRAREVAMIDPNTEREPPDEIRRGAARFVRSVVQSNGRLLMLLDTERVIGEETLDVDGQQRGSR